MYYIDNKIMKELLVSSVLISLVFLAIKIFESKLIKKEEINFKNLANESIYVLFAASGAQFVLSQMGDISSISSMFGDSVGEVGSGIPNAFTNEPDF
ncbi:MAG: hypothetical protein CMF80_06955 [Candidatus Marinimicrobia bacterium]|nr:hypothetical protein [Candidatus Neomarinimicrobiota bacterium]|tara:strand:- start:370 stop:660 length:291 start_codon:yes stop_codon:yes gene_type:complete